MNMRAFCLAKLFRQSAFQAQRGKLRGKFHDQYGIGKTAQCRGSVYTPGDEQKGQSRRQPQQESENIGAAPFGERGNILTVVTPSRLCSRATIQIGRASCRE